MNKLLKTLCILLPITTTLSMATIYSDGTNTEDWSVYDGQGTIDSKDGAIKFTGDGLNTGYRLRINDNQNNILNWTMNSFGNPYTIYVRVNTTVGRKYLRYRQDELNLGLSESKKYIHYALHRSNGNISRNISEDIKKYLDAELINIEWLYIKGDISIDNVETKSSDNNGNDSFKELMNEEFAKAKNALKHDTSYLRFYDNQQFAVIIQYGDDTVDNVTHYTLKNNELVSFDGTRLMETHYLGSTNPRHEVSADKKRLTIYDTFSTGEYYAGIDADRKTIYDISDFNNVKKIKTEIYDNRFTGYVGRKGKTLDEWKAFNLDGSINNDAISGDKYKIHFNSPNRSVLSRIKLHVSKSGAENIA
ncbi:MAG: hypothetical protein KAU90_11690, partial [Sulfurovaceae bacterium]|nr:hypothetical protein [Sulfurovaceae bacterium]